MSGAARLGFAPVSEAVHDSVLGRHCGLGRGPRVPGGARERANQRRAHMTNPTIRFEVAVAMAVPLLQPAGHACGIGGSGVIWVVP